MSAPLGNKNASKGKPFMEALERIIAQEDGKRLRQAAEKLFDLAAAGEEWAIEFLVDRLDGKVSQGIDVRSTSTVTIAISDTDSMVAEALAARADSASPQSLPH